jgi:predicted methyltransferase
MNKDIINAVREYALANYTRSGWDILVECWSDEDIYEIVAKNKSPVSAIKKVRDHLRPLADYRSEVAAASW